MIFIINLLIKMLETNLVKTVIAIGINKLLDAKNDGITKDISILMIDAIAKSNSNPTTHEMFKGALDEIK